jgi:hypothetical protein
LTNADAPKLIKIARHFLANCLIPVYLIDNLFSTNKKTNQIHSYDAEENRILCFIHHSKTEELDDFDVDCLKQLNEIGFYVLLVTNANISKPDFINEVFLKAKHGRDLGGLRDFARSLNGIQKESLEILYMNNSLAWGNGSMKILIDQLRNFDRSCLVFPTSSEYPHSHVQPYLIYASLDSDGIKKFSESFEWIRNWKLKRSIVFLGEYKIWEKLRATGWKSRVLAPYDEVLLEENTLRKNIGENLLSPNSRYYNATQHMWRVLPKFGIFGVKRSLISHNPAGLSKAPLEITEALGRLKKP